MRNSTSVLYQGHRIEIRKKTLPASGWVYLSDPRLYIDGRDLTDRLSLPMTADDETMLACAKEYIDAHLQG